jgi:ABC-type sugar transport system ATPase subunit
MRDGKNVAVLNVSETDTQELVRLMVGRTNTDMYPKAETEIGAPVLEVENLTCSIARNISFRLNRGEILGLFGLVGSGRAEVVEGLIGLRSCEVSNIRLNGGEIHVKTPLEAKKYGIVYVPSDRKRDGLVLIHSVKDNLTVTILEQLREGLAINRKKERRYCDEWVERINVKTPSRDTPVESLSGGNQQKVAIAKWLLTDPKVIIMNDPTRGIDVGAKVEVYKIMESLCEQGISIIMVSSELPETMGITDRMLVFSDGKIVGEVVRKDYEQHKILQMAVGGN